MKNKLFLTLAVMFLCMTAFAQSIPEGFYRVQNQGSGYYLYVNDCTGDVSTLGADMGALELWANLDAAISDPGSVIYLKHAGSNTYDLTSQGTGVHEITGRYMTIAETNGKYMVYNSGQYLYDVGESDVYDGLRLVGAKTNNEMPGKSQYRVWNAPLINSSSSTNYFGFKPTVTASGKYYAPFYADFAYTPKSEVKTWYVSAVDKANAIAVVKEITGTVAKRQPVFVECPSSATSGNKVDLTTAAGTAATTNLLNGVFFANSERSSISHKGKNPAYVVFNPTTMRMLGTDSNGKLAFVNTTDKCVDIEVYDNSKWQNKFCIPHNQSYLTVDSDCPATLTVMTESEYQAFLASQVKLGDVNGDGKISVTDATWIIDHVIGNVRAGFNQKAADTNKDGKITVNDAVQVIIMVTNGIK